MVALGRTNPQIFIISSHNSSQVNNPARFHETRLQTFRIILFMDRQTAGLQEGG